MAAVKLSPGKPGAAASAATLAAPTKQPAAAAAAAVAAASTATLAAPTKQPAAAAAAVASAQGGSSGAAAEAHKPQAAAAGGAGAKALKPLAAAQVGAVGAAGGAGAKALKPLAAAPGAAGGAAAGAAAVEAVQPKQKPPVKAAKAAAAANEAEGGGAPVKPYPTLPPEHVEAASDIVVLSFNTHNGGALRTAERRAVLVPVLTRADVVLLQEYNSVTRHSLDALLEAMNAAASPGRCYQAVLSTPGGNAESNQGVPLTMQAAERHALLYDSRRIAVVRHTTLICEPTAQPLPISYAPLAARLRLLPAAAEGAADLVVVSVHMAPTVPVRDRDWANLHTMLGASSNALMRAGLWGAAVGSLSVTGRNLDTLPPLLVCGDFNGPAEELRAEFNPPVQSAAAAAGGGGGGGTARHRGNTDLVPMEPLFTDMMRECSSSSSRAEDDRLLCGTHFSTPMPFPPLPPNTVTNALDSKAYDNMLFERGAARAYHCRTASVCGPNTGVSDHQPIFTVLSAVRGVVGGGGGKRKGK